LKVKLILFFVVLYLTGAFAWWTYSLISLSEKVYVTQKQNLELQTSLALYEMDVLSQECLNPQGQPVLINNKSYLLDTALFSAYFYKSFGNLFELHFYPNSEELLLPVIKPSELLVQESEKELTKRKRAYYSEALFFMFLLFIGVVVTYKSIDKVLQLNKQQKNFMLSVTHELKTPVAAIKLITQTLNKHNLVEEKRTELLAKADTNSDRLTKLIDGLLLALKIESKTIDTSYKPINLYESILEIVKEIKSHPSFEGEIEVNNSLNFSIIGDPISLRIAFSNIIENAVKYSNGKAKVQIDGNENDMSISFADQGIGIPKSQHKKIFEKFYRVGDEEIRNTKGTGIGLFLVQNILKLHKAKISVAPNYPNGTIFKIRFK
jgi:two-component system phosphate regulon sensor histidine kinase PhoR